MRDGVGAGLGGNLDQTLGNKGPRNGGAKEIQTLVKRVCPEHRKDEVTNELFADIFDENVLGFDAEQFGLLAGGVQLFALAEVRGEGHDLALVFGLKPLQDDGGVEAPGIGQDDFLRRAHLHVLHRISAGR